MFSLESDTPMFSRQTSIGESLDSYPTYSKRLSLPKIMVEGKKLYYSLIEQVYNTRTWLSRSPFLKSNFYLYTIKPVNNDRCWQEVVFQSYYYYAINFTSPWLKKSVHPRSQTLTYRRATLQRNNAPMPQFIRKKLLRAAIYKKSPLNMLTFIKICDFVRPLKCIWRFTCGPRPRAKCLSSWSKEWSS